MDQLQIMVCVTGQKTCERLINEGARIAKELDGQIIVVHVATSKSSFLGNSPEEEADALEYLFRCAQASNAQMNVLKSENVLESIVNFSAQYNIDCIVLGVASGRDALSFAHSLRLRLPNVDIRPVHTS